MLLYALSHRRAEEGRNQQRTKVVIRISGGKGLIGARQSRVGLAKWRARRDGTIGGSVRSETSDGWGEAQQGRVWWCGVGSGSGGDKLRDRMGQGGTK